MVETSQRTIMNISQLLQQFKSNPQFSTNVAYWQDQDARNCHSQSFPEWMKPELIESLRMHGIQNLYTHQAASIQKIIEGNNVVISTGTASGKSLCYQIPILNKILTDGRSTSLLFFPTKALTYDQLNSFYRLVQGLDSLTNRNITAVYDGDTPPSHRGLIRQKTQILLTNPDMLNIGILPHHTSWAKFFENLKYIVIDEIHLYRGVFGSHIGNLIRRINRICDFYGAKPQFIMTSATIANPVDLAQKLIEKPVEEISLDGSPKGKKSFIIYNPPLVNPELGIREGVLVSSTKISSLTLFHNIQTLVFCGTRRFVELLLREIQEINPHLADYIRGYRSGYLKKERREIEEGLKNNSIKLAVATNALELGVDIGGVDAVIMAGYPGSICSLWQRVGRSGRSMHSSVAVLITSMNPLDQFFARNPNYLLERPLEQALINPDNPLILLPHVKSAAFELPFSEKDQFGNIQWAELIEYLDYLCSEGVLQKKRDKYYWLSNSYPSNDYSLRSTTASKVLIQFDNGKERETIGEVDYSSALWMVHPGAVYLQDGKSYLVKNLDLENFMATLVTHNIDYYTDPIVSQEIEPLTVISNKNMHNYEIYYGEIEVNTQVTGFKKVKEKTRENLANEMLDLPSLNLQTTGFWLVPNEKCIAKMRAENKWFSDGNDYGKDWKRLSEIVRKRDQYRCQSCGRSESGTSLHVHHKVPFKTFTSVDRANTLDNLISLCSTCHRLAELNIRIRSALSGLKHLMYNLAPLLVLCESSDLGALAESNAKFADLNPAILIYDTIPAGIGLSNSLYERIDDLLEKCLQLARLCQCQDGCPSCVGPVAEMGLGGKKETIFLLELLLNGDGECLHSSKD